MQPGSSGIKGRGERGKMGEEGRKEKRGEGRGRRVEWRREDGRGKGGKK